MDPAYLHILINHFPIILAVMGATAAVLSVFVRGRSTWIYATASLTIAGLFAYPTVLTGERAEDSMRPLWYVVKGTMGTHEDAGQRAMYVLIVTGLISAYAWWRATRRYLRENEAIAPVWLRAAVIVGGLASAGTAGWAAKQADPILHYSPRLPHPSAPGIEATLPGHNRPDSIPANLPRGQQQPAPAAVSPAPPPPTATP